MPVPRNSESPVCRAGSFGACESSKPTSPWRSTPATRSSPSTATARPIRARAGERRLPQRRRAVLAQAWKHAYEQHGWSGGFRDDNYTENLKKYYGTRNAVEAGNERAFVAECGFLTNRDDKALLTGPGGVNRVVRALFDALGI
ncbi:hypothetical protein NKH18_06135 [Streptomyces sp. M10(2022)]